MQAMDLTGNRYGRLTAIKYVGRSKHKKPLWLVKCDCGTKKEVVSPSLTNGVTQSCGCLQRELVAKRVTTHGDSKSRLYVSWRGMKERCSSPKHKDFKYYGGKGIKIVWESFAAFRDWANANGYIEGLVIDRVDSGRNYEPANCQWITPSENTARRNAA